MDPADISLSPACRILVVSKDITQGQELVSRKQDYIRSLH